MSVHTPGPWEWVEGDREQMPKLVSGDEVVLDLGDGEQYYPSPGWLEGDIEGPNARLIAAAPELLEALENLENDDGAIPDHAWTLVQNAIAKARGD